MNRNYYFILVLFLLIGKNSAHSQNYDSSVSHIKNDFWVSFGYGPSTVLDAELGAGVGAIINFERKNNFFCARVVHDINGREDIVPREEIFDAGILVGIGTHDSLWFKNASIGIAYTYILERVFDHLDTLPTEVVNVYRAEKHHLPGI